MPRKRVQRPRIISFRVSAEEYQGLQDAIEGTGFYSVSEFVRSSVRRARIEEPNVLVEKVVKLEVEVKRLSQVIGAIAAAAQEETETTTKRRPVKAAASGGA